MLAEFEIWHITLAGACTLVLESRNVDHTRKEHAQRAQLQSADYKFINDCCRASLTLLSG